MSGLPAPSVREPFGIVQALTISLHRKGRWMRVKRADGGVASWLLLFTPTPQTNLRFASSPAGEPFGLPQSNLRFASSLSEGAFWHCASTNYKPALKGEVDASETSRRRGCIEVALVYANPSVNPPYGVLPAPRPGSLLGTVPPNARARYPANYRLYA